MRVKEIVELIKKSNKTVVLTGAGVSTDSGIPDFRGANGLYNRYPSDVLSNRYFLYNTELFYEAFIDKFKTIIKAEPNEGHKILAKWEEQGLLQGIITQNVDGLHQKAGNKNVIEYHGTIRTFTKMGKEGITVKLEDILDEDNNINYYYQGIRDNEHLLKPDVILFGDKILRHEESRELIKHTDLVFIIGTSFVVQPFNTLIKRLLPPSTVVVINNDFVELKTRARKIRENGNITDILQEIDSYLF